MPQTELGTVVISAHLVLVLLATHQRFSMHDNNYRNEPTRKGLAPYFVRLEHKSQSLSKYRPEPPG